MAQKVQGPKSVTTAQVFLDLSGRRWKRTIRAIGLLVLAAGLLLGALTPIALAPVHQAQMNTAADYPRQAVTSVGHPLRVIGEGVLNRIDRVQRSGGETYLADPFSNRVFRGATAEEASTIGADKLVMEHYGTMPDHQIALTFDDGPDSRWTGPLLDLLSRKKVPSTFFPIGQNVLRNRALFERVVREGHMVGNHTLTHIDFDDHSVVRNREEVISDERIMTAVAGYSTRLIRLPYADEETNVRGVLESQQLGQLEVGFNLDPVDWSYRAGQVIPQPTLDGTGQVVLLHDGGGNRAPTLAFLEKFIDSARAQGYSFSTVQPLLPAEYVPVHKVVPQFADRVTWLGLWAVMVAPPRLLGLLFWFGVGSVLPVSVLAIVLASLNWRRQRARQWAAPTGSPSVSVVVAAYNEEAVIAKTLSTLRRSEYPDFEVVVVNDGSTDATQAILEASASTWPRLRVLQQPNRGKAAAMNLGVEATEGDIIVTLDADTIFAPDTIGQLVRHFSDPRVGAVAGLVKVGNRRNLLTAWQSLEYLSGISIIRMAESALGVISIVPGACAAWRREAVKAAGGFSGDTLAEDCDLTISIQRAGYRVTQDHQAVAWTEAPMSVRALAKQRLRWMFGTVQAFRKHRDIVLRPRHGVLGMVILPYALFSVAMPVLFLPLTCATAAINLANGAWHGLALFACLMVGVDLMISVAAVLILRERPWHVLVAVVYRLIHDPLRVYLLYAVLYSVVRGRPMGWNKLKRSNSVAVAGMA